MYPRSKFQEVLLEIRQEMARDADFDVDLFAEIVRTGAGPRDARIHSLSDPATGLTGSRKGRSSINTAD
ncbi:MAG: hypothetical protein ABIR33_11410 [Pyrinomonadaceae bacterium]